MKKEINPLVIVVSVVVLLVVVVLIGMRVMATPTPSAASDAPAAPAATYNGQQIPAGAPPQGFEKAKELEKEKGQTPGQ